ncbi:cytochrome P450 [Bradyrhizobium sp. AUGA SZCCT0240]|uniref:cytochrome P450 n=1 Tax=Bradyrhizobium sp. AUGA SZCCT0240 TaxID=2807669 RepID=UPI001BAAF981|nr:cytochrome P450 [Bradyrhizobium sp. AUGA SZCCT0240]MBR1256363.1 cytochrome P450 [Bradyrhizobium sp. AUGA SZCCT0240]
MLTKTLDAAIADPSMYADPGAYHELFAQLRKEDPVHWTEIEGFRPFWTVSKYNDILEIEKQGDKFINWPRLSLNSIADEERVRAGSGRGSTVSLRMLVNMDGAEHRAHRSITQSWFMPTNLRKLEAELADLAKEFVDRMEAVSGSCDFVKDVAVWYPLRVIMTILGVPREDDHRMLAWTKALLSSEDEEMAAGLRGVEARQAAIQEFFRYFGALSAKRRAEPKDDLASVIANAKVEGQAISDFETQSYYLIISTAGHDTTSSSSAGGLLALLQNPAELAKLRANPDLLPSAIEEIIRWVSPVTHFFRTATEDYVLRGKQIKAGDSLMMCYPSANRDEEIFPDPYTFKIDRTPNRHIAFGYGPHLCLGLNLARMELKALFKELLSRVDTIELAGDPAWIKATIVTGLKRLPIRYTTRKQAA